jgi:threonine dehydrogenase-like Zn-dependent dehydrogenase
LDVLKKGGTCILVGIFETQDVMIPGNLFVQREISLVGSQGYCWDFQTALTLVQKGMVPLRKMISHILPLASLREGFELLMDPKNKTLKVVIKID